MRRADDYIRTMKSAIFWRYLRGHGVRNLQLHKTEKIYLSISVSH